jgi:hypothetical protein
MYSGTNLKLIDPDIIVKAAAIVPEENVVCAA